MSDKTNTPSMDKEMTLPEIKPKENVLLDVRNLKMHFPITKGIFSKVKGYVKAVDDISFFIHRGETLGLVGESGCGKTTVGRCVSRAYQPTGGQVLYQQNGTPVDLAQLNRKGLSPYRKDIRVIFQDPYSSLNPRMTVFEIVSEVLRVNKLIPVSGFEDRVAETIQRVGLRPEYIRRYPHAFSGGERQRIVIARALVTRSRLIVADEAVSALDVSIRAQILNLMEDLQKELNLTYLFVSHDLSVIRHICDRVVVMYVGKVVEVASVNLLFNEPQHPYTEALMSAVLSLTPATETCSIAFGWKERSRIHPTHRRDVTFTRAAGMRKINVPPMNRHCGRWTALTGTWPVTSPRTLICAARSWAKCCWWV